MNAREIAIKEARDWLGTPWQHHQKTKGVAVDCVGLLMAAADAAGVGFGDVENYYRSPNGDALLNKFQGLYKQVNTRYLGCIVLFRFAGVPHHVGLMTSNDTFIHASFSDRCVVEQTFDPFWERRLVAIFDPFEVN